MRRPDVWQSVVTAEPEESDDLETSDDLLENAQFAAGRIASYICNNENPPANDVVMLCDAFLALDERLKAGGAFPFEWVAGTRVGGWSS